MPTTQAASVLITACQIRAARAMLLWSRQELARAAGIGPATVTRLEKGFGVLKLNARTRDRLLACFSREGITLRPEIGDAAGPGVHYGRYPGRILG